MNEFDSVDQHDPPGREPTPEERSAQYCRQVEPWEMLAKAVIYYAKRYRRRREPSEAKTSDRSKSPGSGYA